MKILLLALSSLLLANASYAEGSYLYHCEFVDLEDKEIYIYENKHSYVLTLGDNENLDLTITQLKKNTPIKHKKTSTQEYFSIEFHEKNNVLIAEYLREKQGTRGNLILKEKNKVSMIQACINATAELRFSPTKKK